MRKLLDLERLLRVRLFTGEFEVILCLYHYGPMRSRDLAKHTKSSIANFHLILRRLKEGGVLVVRSGEGDRRAREYDLSTEVRGKFDAFFNP